MGEAGKLNHKIVQPIIIVIVPCGKTPPSMGKIASLICTSDDIQVNEMHKVHKVMMFYSPAPY